MRLSGAVAIAILVGRVAVASAADDGGDNFYERLAKATRARYDALIAARTPKPVPPVPIKPTWRAVRIGSFELGAPLVALAAGELDGDRKSGELYAVTSREVIAIGFKNGRLIELGRVAFAGDRAMLQSRDVVGTAVIENGELVAAASPWAKELRVKWHGKTLVAQQGGPGFLVCPNVRVQLQPGRNHFSNGTFETRCKSDLVDRDGHPVHVRAELATTGKLEVVVERCRANTACEQIGKHEQPNVGVAFAIADVDRDGEVEIIVSEASAPGASDSAKVFTLGAAKPMYKRSFQGGVAGLVVVDGDDPDDVAEVIAAVRLFGSTRVDLWRLD